MGKALVTIAWTTSPPPTILLTAPLRCQLLLSWGPAHACKEGGEWGCYIAWTGGGQTSWPLHGSLSLRRLDSVPSLLTSLCRSTRGSTEHQYKHLGDNPQHSLRDSNNVCLHNDVLGRRHALSNMVTYVHCKSCPELH